LLAANFVDEPLSHLIMILYKPTNQLFSNRLEAKLKLGHSRFNKIVKYSPDDIVFINKESLATDEQVYSSTH
jgi:hypothetical protein